MHCISGSLIWRYNISMRWGKGILGLGKLKHNYVSPPTLFPLVTCSPLSSHSFKTQDVLFQQA